MIKQKLFIHTYLSLVNERGLVGGGRSGVGDADNCKSEGKLTLCIMETNKLANSLFQMA